MKVIEELTNYGFEKDYLAEQLNINPRLKNILSQIKDKETIVDFEKYNMSKYEYQSLKNIIEVTKRQNTVERKINTLSQPYKNILFYKYVCKYETKQIAKRIGYSVTRIYQLHNQALELYENVQDY